jgi:hypothetical protein
MALKLKDFYRGDAKRWRVVWPNDIAGAVIVFGMKKLLTQEVPDLQIVATLDAPDENGRVYGGFFEITATQSRLLVPRTYFCDHEITLPTGEVGTFGAQQINVLADVAKWGS